MKDKRVRAHQMKKQNKQQQVVFQTVSAISKGCFATSLTEERDRRESGLHKRDVWVCVSAIVFYDCIYWATAA